MNRQHVEVKALGEHVRRALESVRYGAADVPVVAAESVSSYSGGNDGQRGFVIALNLQTGERKAFAGAWGGGAVAAAPSPVDADVPIAIPEHGIVIKGQMGYPRTFATIYAHPNAVGAYLLPSGEPSEELSDAEQQAIYCFAAIKGGEYRRDEMRRRGVTADVVDGLVARGYLKRNRAGATQITTKGKNARTVQR